LADDAIKYIIFLSDANRLYDVALSLYDFNLVLMVAQHSQKVRLYQVRFNSWTDAKHLRIQKNTFHSFVNCASWSQAIKNTESMIILGNINKRYTIFLMLDRNITQK